MAAAAARKTPTTTQLGRRVFVVGVGMTKVGWFWIGAAGEWGAHPPPRALCKKEKRGSGVGKLTSETPQIEPFIPRLL